MAQQVTVFGRDEAFKDGSDDILREAGKVAGVEVMNQGGETLGGFAGPGDDVWQVLGKDGVVVHFQRFGKGAAKRRKNLRRVNVVEVQCRELSGRASQALIEQNFAKPECSELYLVTDSVSSAINYINSYEPTVFERWLTDVE